MSAVVGVIVNPMSGRDVRRLSGRASNLTHESKRSTVSRIVVGAAAGGADRICLFQDPFRIVQGAVEFLRLPAHLDVLKAPLTHSGKDTLAMVEELIRQGCDTLVVLGGDGTNRWVCKAWGDRVLIPLSTGTNNVFPLLVEPTLAGMAAGLIASGKVEAPAKRAKLVQVTLPSVTDLALVDAVLLDERSTGNLKSFDADRIRQLVLARSEPGSVGASPIGGFLHRAGIDDDHGVWVECDPSSKTGRELLIPVTPGVFAPVNVRRWSVLELEQPVPVRGPGVLAFDGDREHLLDSADEAVLRVTRGGPRLADPLAIIEQAAAAGIALSPQGWFDGRFDSGGGR